MADNKIANAIKFLKGEEKSLPATKTEGQVYFAYKNVGTAEKPSYTGAIYIDTPIGGAQNRIKMTANADIAEYAKKANADSQGNLITGYLRNASLTGNADSQTFTFTAPSGSKFDLKLNGVNDSQAGLVTSGDQTFPGYKTLKLRAKPSSIVGSDAENSNGWYKVATSTMDGYNNTNILYYVKNGNKSESIGILDFEMRSNNTSIQCYACKWLVRGDGFTPDMFRVVIDGMTWTLYVYQSVTQWSRISITEISNTNINGNNPDYNIIYYNSTIKETTEPDKKISSSDGGQVYLASKTTNDGNGQNIANTYIKSLSYSNDGKQLIATRGSGDTSLKLSLPIANATKSGIVTTDAQSFGGTKTFVTINSTNLTITGSDGFNYSGIGSGTADAARPVWFANNSGNGKPVINDNFTYNPATQTLKVLNLSGTAEKANKDSAGNDIRSTYVKYKSIRFTASSDKVYLTESNNAGSSTNATVGDSNISVATIPGATSLTAGVITTGTQTFSGNKTFNNSIIVNDCLKVKNTATFDGLIVNSSGIRIEGNGKCNYCKIMTLKITGAYINRPITIEVGGRGRYNSRITIMFANTNSIDPELQGFTTDWENCYYIKKVSTSTWEVYASYSETFGTCVINRLYGEGYYYGGINITWNMENISALPEGTTQASYAGNVGYSLNTDKLDGFHGSLDSIASTYVLRSTTGHIYINYINSNTSNNENPSISQIIVTNGDNFYRKASLVHLKKSLGSMPASDVYTWAKASTKPSYSWGEITNKPSTFTPSSHTHYSLSTIGDQRSTATTPDSYSNTFVFQGLKNNSTIDITDAGTYSYILGLRGWNDYSGGKAHELAFNNSGIYTRMGSTTSWESWRKILDSSNYTSYTVTKSGSGASGIWGISISGNAATATKLSTARAFSITGGVTASTVNFDGSEDISISINSVKESYLSWGGKNFSGDFGCIDAAMVPDLGANRLAFGKPAGITIEYSRDSGKTWLNYEATDAQKCSILSTGDFGFAIGKSDSKNMANEKCMLRIILDTDKIPVYTDFNKFALYISTNGSYGCYCTIDASLESAPNIFIPFADKVKISGWSGWNIINVTNFRSYGNTPSSQYGLIRFTFGCTSGNDGKYFGLQVLRIMGFGGVGWTIPSNMARYGSIYSYDSNQNVTFPAAIVAPNFYGSLNGVATKLARSGDINSPMTFNWGGKDGQPLWLWGSDDGINTYVYNPSNFSVKYAISAGSANSVTWNNVSGKPSSLPASDVYAWAKASTKPSYSWGEITNKPSTFTPSSHDHSWLVFSGYDTISSAANDTTANWSKKNISFHYYTKAGQLIGQPSQYGYLFNIGVGNDVHQLWMTQVNGSILHRGGNSSGWGGAWQELLDSSNYTSYTVTKDGSGANGTWNINISGSSASCTGNAATATKLQIARTISLTGSITGSGTFDGSGNLSIITSTNHSHSQYLPLAGGTMTGTINFTANKLACNFRSDDNKYASGIMHQSAGNEALVFAAANAATSFIFKSGKDPVSMDSTTWQVIVPSMQIKGQSVYINSLIANGITPTYNFYVNGTTRCNGTLGVGNGSNAEIDFFPNSSSNPSAKIVAYNDRIEFVFV